MTNNCDPNYYGDENHSFYLALNHKDFEILLNKSIPNKVERLFLGKVDFNFNFGEFVFNIKNNEGEYFKLPFYYEEDNFVKSYDNINILWKFLEEIILKEEPLFLHLLRGGEERVIYVERVNKKEIRFMIANSIKLYNKERKGEILRYSFRDFDVDLDVIINKKELITQFYNRLYNLFKNYENIAYFEPPLIDFNFWIKDSNVIKEYLNIKRKAPK